MSHDADIIWLEFFNSSEIEQRRLGQYEYLKPFAARAGENARRGATLFAFFDNRNCIDAEVMIWAIQVVDYSLKEWLRYSDRSDLDSKIMAVQRLDDWIIQRCKVDGVSKLERQNVMRSVSPHSIRKKDIFYSALKELLELNRVRYDGQWIIVNPTLLI